MFTALRRCLCTSLALIALAFATSGCAPLLFFLQVAFLLPPPNGQQPDPPPAGQPVLPPEVVDVAVSTPEDTAVSLSVLTGNSAIDVVAATLQITIDLEASHGTVTIDPTTKKIKYTPEANYNGPVTFTLSVCDANLPPNCATASVTVTVTPVNDAPVADNESYNTDEDIALDVAASGVLINDTDADGDPLTAILVTGPSQGTLLFNADGSFSYTAGNGNTLPAGQSLMDTFTYKANDGTSDSNIATVTIEVIGVHNLPIAVNDAVVTSEDTPVIVPVLANDTDPDIGDLIMASLEVGPVHGISSLNPDGSFTYTPNADYNGLDSFTYRATDSFGFFSIATVNITVSPVNEPPVAVNDSFSTTEDTPLFGNVIVNDIDMDGDFIIASLNSGPPHGTLDFNPDGSFIYTPLANYNGSDFFTYMISDGQGGTSTATVNITVNPVNDLPIANNEVYYMNEDTVLNSLGVLVNETDSDGDPLTAILITGPTHGSLTLNADGTFIYEPDANFNGTDDFTYKARDGMSDSNVATAHITVSPINDPPVAGSDSLTTEEDTPLVISFASLLVNDFDVDGDPITIVGFSVNNLSIHGTVTMDATSFTYTPDADYNGPDSFDYHIHDSHNFGSGIGTINITVNPVNDPPVGGG